MSAFGEYRKTLVAIVGGTLAWAQLAIVPDGHVSRSEWYGLCAELAAAFGVYAVSNDLPQTAWHSTVAALGFPAAGGRANEPADLAPDPRP